MKPDELLYNETHEWVGISEAEGAKVGTIGISDFAVEQLTDLVFMDLPEVGRIVTASEEFGEVESVKAVSPMYSPVTGEVIEVNTELPDQLESLGEDPFGRGWMIKVKISDESNLDSLLNYQAYRQQCEQ